MKIEISKKLVLVNSASYVVSRVLQVSVFVWLQQYLLRRIPAEEYSLLPVLGAVMVFTPILTTILTAGISRYVTEAYARGNAQRVGQIASTMFLILACTGFLVLAAGLVLAWNVDRVLTIQPDYAWSARVMMAIMMSSFAVRLPFVFFGCGFHVRQKFVLRNLIDLGTQLLSIAILFILLLADGPRVMWVVVASNVGALCDATITAVMARNLVPELKIRLGHFRWRLARELISFGAWNSAIQVTYAVRQAAGPLILNRLSTPVDVASSHIGSIPERQVGPLLGDLFWPLLPALTAMHAKDEKERLRYTYLRLNRIALWVSMMLATPLMVYAHTFFRLYLRERYSMYVTAGTVMVLTFAAYPVMFAVATLWHVCQAVGRIRMFSVITSTINVLCVFLTWFLVHNRGMGAIAPWTASALSNAAGCLLGLWPIGLRALRIEFRLFLFQTIVPGLVPSVVGAALWFALNQLVQPSTWAELFACVAGGMVGYIGAVVLCSQRSDRADIGRAWRSCVSLCRAMRKEQ